VPHPPANPDETSPAGSSAGERFRPTSGLLTGVLLVLVGLLGVGLALGDRDAVPAWLGALGVVAAVLGWAYLLRPRVRVAGPDLVLRNPFSTVRIPLAAIEELDVRQVLVVRAGDRQYTSPGLGRTRRSILRGPRRDEAANPAAQVAASSYGEFAEDRLRWYAEQARDAAGVRLLSPEQEALAEQVRRRPAWPEILGLAAGVAAFVVLALLG
jgi:hypothetical protein